MSRDPRYQKLLNSKRWKMIRADYLRKHPLCERCRREGIAAGVLPDGYITSAVDVHHKTPVERGRTQQEMEWLAYNLGGNNLEALCIPCHIKTHQEMRSHTKEKVKENKARARRRFMEANDPNYGEKADAYMKNLEEQAKMEDIIYPDDDPNYGEKADAYMKNLEEQAKMEDIIYPDDDTNYGRDNERPQGQDVDSHEDGQRGLPSSDQHDEG